MVSFGVSELVYSPGEGLLRICVKWNCDSQVGGAVKRVCLL